MNKTQRKRISELLNAHINYRTFRKRIKVIRDPIELHQIAFLANDTATWHDEGFQWPQSIAEHPYCDAGTALMLYWMESPEHWHEIGVSENADKTDVANLKYVQSLEFYYLNCLYRTSKIKFDPEIDFSKQRNQTEYRWIPVGMFKTSPGSKVTPLKWKHDDDYKIVLT